MKTRNFACLALCAALLGAVAYAATPAPDVAPIVLYVRCGKLMTSADAALKGPTSLIVTNGRITAIGDNLPIPAGAQQLDYSAYTVVPGFIDSHIHLWTGPQGSSPSYGLQTLRAQKAVGYALSSGIVGVRVLGTDGFIDIALADAVDEGTILGPHILPAGHPISIPAGHTDHFTYPATIDLDAYYTPLQGFINSPADAEKAVHLQVKYGAKVIKVMASGGVGSPLDSPTSEQISPAELAVICEQAHMAHLKVSAHDENAKTILDALHAGVDSLERGSELTPEAVEYMKAHHVWWDPTVFVVDNIVQGGDHGPVYRIAKGKALSEKHFASFKLGLSSGLAPQMAAGSDMQYEPGTGTVLDEMITMVKYGATPKQALIAATTNGAFLAGWDDLGSIAVVKKTKAVIFKGKLVPTVNK